MECVLRVEMGNAAFFHEEQDDAFDLEGHQVRDGYELARLLRVAADAVEGGGCLPAGPVFLRDYNGNTVGSLDFEGE